MCWQAHYSGGVYTHKFAAELGLEEYNRQFTRAPILQLCCRLRVMLLRMQSLTCCCFRRFGDSLSLSLYSSLAAFALVNHGVLMVGWGVTDDANKTPYWICKNSWYMLGGGTEAAWVEGQPRLRC